MKKIAGFLLSVFLFLTIATPVQAQTTPWSGVCVGSSDEGDRAYGVATIQGLECLIANIFTVLITVLGLAGFVMFIIGSFRWLISGGNTKGTEDARKTMTYAVVGLVVALSAFIILRLIANFTGVYNILEFRVPTSDTTYSSGGASTP